MPLSPRHLRLAIKKLALRAGMDPDVVVKKVRVHALRHGHATHLLLRNVPLKVVAERFGHASTHVTATKQLNEEGYRTRRGGKFYHQTVRQILEVPRYRDLAVDGKA
ncbi:hypothetical protein LIP_2301 [Limnochorda pilosa]|uniref:Tyr recombinase domain-containing protein n=2 Tax=Limnochorda pilosa TaxID=1555112 RepID=A0A0K2SMA4_LIMPI|nr:hypothetical protein LIP_2301 [Limnochorda pilosa]